MSPIRGVLLDLDGVVWRNHDAVPGAVETVERLHSLSIPVGVVTNTSSRRRSWIARRLEEIGALVPADKIVSSAWTTARHIVDVHGANSTVIAYGKYGALVGELRGLGLDVVDPRDLDAVGHAQGPLIACAGYADTLTSDVLHGFLAASDRVSHFYASERDRWYGGLDGPLPGGGWIIAAIEEIVGREAVTLGKPSAHPVRLGSGLIGCEPREVLMVGDSVDADVRSAKAAGAISVLFVDPERSAAELQSSALAPDFTISDLHDVVAIVEAGLG